MVEIGSKNLTLSDFKNVVFGQLEVTISQESVDRLIETRNFIDDLTQKNIKLYGITTGFADLRNFVVDPSKSSQLSVNIIKSHDAGIGKNLDSDIVLGAMLIRANALAKGYSGFSIKSLSILVQMINKKIIPLVPETGSLGASGDLAQLARLGHAMMGCETVMVQYKNQIVTAKFALESEGIAHMTPTSKEGLALTNGTSFMNSILAICYIREIKALENLFACTSLFMDSVNTVDSAFFGSLQSVRGHVGQQLVAQILNKFKLNSSFVDKVDTQNDYCIRCMPQIYGPKLETIFQCKSIVEKEMNAPSDNPLIFKNYEISNDVGEHRTFKYKDDMWCVLSGGNFHGEYLSQMGDMIRICNAKIGITVERQTTYMLNPSRNKILPIYLIANSNDIGLMSGFMIPHYTLNSLVQQICHSANPVSIFNITSGNESEDVVSYGHSSCLILKEQISKLEDITAIYLIICLQVNLIINQIIKILDLLNNKIYIQNLLIYILNNWNEVQYNKSLFNSYFYINKNQIFLLNYKAYSIARQQYIKRTNQQPNDSLSEKLFDHLDKFMQNHSHSFPLKQDQNFQKLYELASIVLNSGELLEITKYPLSNSNLKLNLRPGI